MNKKVSLKEIVGTKIVYAIILTSYYWMWARTDWKDWYETVRFNLLKTFCWCNGCSCFWCCHSWSWECRQYRIYLMDDCVVDFGFIYYSHSDVCSYG